MALEKEAKLRNWMRRRAGVLVAYSGGVDSTYLALIATQELEGKAVCVTGVSPSVSTHQLELAKSTALSHGFRHLLLQTAELDDSSYRKNSGDRCYFCKTELYRKIGELRGREFAGFEIVDGTNADDMDDFRPGLKAAAERSVRSPLEEFGFTKEEIRMRSRHFDLETWDMPASPCLSSRIAVGIPVTIERLDKVERGEEILRENGFREFRLRNHGDSATIEIATLEMNSPFFEEKVKAAASRIEGLGFKSVNVNRNGFRSGSFNGIETKVGRRPDTV